MSPSSSERAARFRALLEGPAFALPGAINALSARLIEVMGFDALYISGAVLSNSVGGVADIGLMTLCELERHARSIAMATSIPILADADTGFGGLENIRRTVQALEHAGVSGIHLEDQEFPKRCGHLEGKQLVSTAAFCEKIAAAVEAKDSPDFVVMARTDARAVEGYDATVSRARAYVDAGADAVFPEALQSEAEFRAFARDVPVPLLANMTEFGRTPYLSVAQFEDMGYRMVLFPVTLQRAAMKAMEEALALIRDTGSQAAYLDHMQTRQALYDLLSYDGKVPH